MEIVARGWGRNHGENAVARRDLITARVGEFDSFSRSETYITSVPEMTRMSPLTGRHLIKEGNVGIRFNAKIVLNGDYLFRLTFNKREIARLFFLQHADCTLEELFHLFSTLQSEHQDEVAIPEEERIAEEEPIIEKESIIEQPSLFDPMMFKKVDELEISVRSANCLKNDNVTYIGELVQKNVPEMLRTPNFGRKSLNEIREVLKSIGLDFGMEVPAWPQFNPMMLKKVDDLELSVRSADCLKNGKIVYVGDLVQKSEEDLLRTPDIGGRSFLEIKEVLASMGLHLGMQVPNWPSQNMAHLARLFEEAAMDSGAHD